MLILKRQQIRWVLANATGIAAFLAFASREWIEPEIANEPGAGGGDLFVWGLTALPIMILFVVAHLIVGGIALTKMRRDWASPFILTTGCWIAVVIFDNAHHAI